MKDITTYICKDGRTRAYVKDTKKVVSYPRLLLEEKLGRELTKSEQVHHIDGDPNNNDIDNLELANLGEHQRMHSPKKYFDKVVKCSWCEKEFIWTALQQRYHTQNTHRKNREVSETDKKFCSKSCAGSYARACQLSANRD